MRKAAPSDQKIGFGSEAALKMATPPTAGTGTLFDCFHCVRSSPAKTV